MLAGYDYETLANNYTQIQLPLGFDLKNNNEASHSIEVGVAWGFVCFSKTDLESKTYPSLTEQKKGNCVRLSFPRLNNLIMCI